MPPSPTSFLAQHDEPSFRLPHRSCSCPPKLNYIENPAPVPALTLTADPAPAVACRGDAAPSRASCSEDQGSLILRLHEMLIPSEASVPATESPMAPCAAAETEVAARPSRFEADPQSFPMRMHTHAPVVELSLAPSTTVGLRAAPEPVHGVPPGFYAGLGQAYVEPAFTATPGEIDQLGCQGSYGGPAPGIFPLQGLALDLAMRMGTAGPTFPPEEEFQGFPSGMPVAPPAPLPRAR
eukprot:RCo026549